MCVEALIEKLQQLDPNKEVYFEFNPNFDIEDGEEYVNIVKVNFPS